MYLGSSPFVAAPLPLLLPYSASSSSVCMVVLACFWTRSDFSPRGGKTNTVASPT